MLSYQKHLDTQYNVFRRQYERKNYNADIVYVINNEIFQGILKDISVGGAFVVTKTTPHINSGDLVTLSIPFTNGHKHVKRTGRVLWKNGTGFAIAFTC